MSRPPGTALRLLQRTLDAAEQDDVIGDLTETFADREDAGARFNRLWFWAQALTFAAAAAARRLRRRNESPSRRSLMERLGSNLRHAWRRLRFEWRYALSVTAILAIGIGPAAAMIAVFERVLLRPLEYREPDRVVLLRLDLDALSGHPGLSMSEATDIRTADIFAQVEVETRLANVSLGDGPDYTSLSQLAITPGMLSMLGVRPVLGRDFTDDDAPAPPPPPPPGTPPPASPPPLPPQPALLDFAAWHTYFGGDPGVVGRHVRINNRSTEIVGVLPSSFRLVTGRAVPQRIDLYTPLRLRDLRPAWQFPTLARLKPGSSVESAQAALDALAAENRRRYPDVYPTRVRYTITPVLDDMTRASAPALRAALAAVVMLLLIALANATALVVARLRTRDLDLAIRSAMGASRRALVGEALAESLLLGAGAAAAGGLLAALSVEGVRRVIPHTVPRWDEIAVGWDLLLYAAVLAGCGLVMSGVVPVLRISRGALAHAMRAGSVQGGRHDGTTSRLVLVGAQIAVTVVLAFGCVQLVRSASELGRVNLGYDANVLTVETPFDFARHQGRKGRAELYQRIRDRVAEIPGVTSVGVVTHLPLSGATMMDGYETDLSKEPTFATNSNYQAVTPGYFRTMRIPVLEGRDFTDAEDAGSEPVAVVDETLAARAFPGEADVVGRTLRLGWGLGNARIVGVAGHAQTIEVGRAVRPQVYVPIGNLFQTAGQVTVRTEGDPRAFEAQVVAAINEVGPGRAVSRVGRLSDNVTAATSTVVALTWLVTSFAASAGLLSAVGLSLVIAFVVHERRRASAIRAALGASRRQVMWTHARTSVVVLASAVPVGLLLAVAAAPLFGGLVYGVAARDAGSLLTAVALAVGAAAVGTWVPVRRAGTANIVSLLRES